MTDDTIGIDISKDRLDALRLSDGTCRSFSNDAHGFRALRTWLRAAPSYARKLVTRDQAAV